MTAVLSCENISFSYGGPAVLEGVSLEVRPGEMLAVVGPNGSGKSTLLKLLCGLLKPAGGNISMSGEDTRNLRARQLARRVAYVPQDFHLSLPFTVEELVLTGRHPHLRPLQFEGSEDFEVARWAMSTMDIADLSHRPFWELSGGERQRVLVAAAIAQQPDALVLDEPSASLDIHYQDELMRLLNGLRTEKNVAVVMALHDLNLASVWCPRVALLLNGKIEVMAGPEEVLTDERLERAYGRGARIARVGGRPFVVPRGPEANPSSSEEETGEKPGRAENPVAGDNPGMAENPGAGDNPGEQE